MGKTEVPAGDGGVQKLAEFIPQVYETFSAEALQSMLPSVVKNRIAGCQKSAVRLLVGMHARRTKMPPIKVADSSASFVSAQSELSGAGDHDEEADEHHKAEGDHEGEPSSRVEEKPLAAEPEGDKGAAPREQEKLDSTCVTAEVIRSVLEKVSLIGETVQQKVARETADAKALDNFFS